MERFHTGLWSRHVGKSVHDSCAEGAPGVWALEVQLLDWQVWLPWVAGGPKSLKATKKGEPSHHFPWIWTLQSEIKPDRGSNWMQALFHIFHKDVSFENKRLLTSSTALIIFWLDTFNLITHKVHNVHWNDDSQGSQHSLHDQLKLHLFYLDSGGCQSVLSAFCHCTAG